MEFPGDHGGFMDPTVADEFDSVLRASFSPGGKMDLAMQRIFTPMIWRLMERRGGG